MEHRRYFHPRQPQIESPVRVEDLLGRCNALLQELEDFHRFVANSKRGRADEVVDIRQFRSAITAELKSLQKLSEKDQTTEKTIHTLKSSNLPFYIAIWATAKASKALTVFSKRFYWDPEPAKDSRTAGAKKFALVDIVSDDGEEWIKVSIIAEHRLIFELAKAQWEESDSEDVDERDYYEDENPTLSESILDRMELVQTVDSLMRAAQAQRVHYKIPRVRVVLPKISNPPPTELVALLDRIKSSGAKIDLGPPMQEQDGHSQLDRLDVKDLTSDEAKFSRLLPSPHPPLTPTLNIDCTILLALVSDLSHTANHPILPNYNGAIRRQIEIEASEHLVPSRLWPAMADKDLVCTEEAAHRMNEIVDTIGTPHERSRAKLLLYPSPPDPDCRASQNLENAAPDLEIDRDLIRRSFASFSDHKIPSSLRIPITVVPAITSEELSTAIDQPCESCAPVPAVSRYIASQLTPINASVFMYGWVKGITTVTSNRAVVKWIENTVAKSIVVASRTSPVVRPIDDQDQTSLSVDDQDSHDIGSRAGSQGTTSQTKFQSEEGEKEANAETDWNGDGQGSTNRDIVSTILLPSIWLREPARSLLGKEKERRK